MIYLLLASVALNLYFIVGALYKKACERWSRDIEKMEQDMFDETEMCK